MFGSKQFLMQTILVDTPQPISNLAVGALVKTIYDSVDLVFQIADKNHTNYPVNSVTLITKDIQSLKAFDGKETSNPNGDIKAYGNSRYLYSNIFQWLNKSGTNWYISKHTYDAPPSTGNVFANPYDSSVGFLSGFKATFLNNIFTTTQITAKNTVIYGGGSETVTSKFYLASTTEVGLANENNIAEGSKLELFTDDASRITKYSGDDCGWWLRTPWASNTSCTQLVGNLGTVMSIRAAAGSSPYGGVRPLCNISNTVMISGLPDANGVYTIL